jgi:hypothetical protein
MLIEGVLTFASGAFPIEIPLKVAFFVGVIAIGDLLLKIFFVLISFERLGGNGGVGVITECAEAAAIELELDHVALDGDGGDAGKVTLTDSHAELLDAAGIFLPIHGSGFVEAKINAYLGTGHVDFEDDLLAGEIGFERGVLSVERWDAKSNSDHGDQEYRANHGDNLLTKLRSKESQERGKEGLPTSGIALVRNDAMQIILSAWDSPRPSHRRR